MDPEREKNVRVGMDWVAIIIDLNVWYLYTIVHFYERVRNKAINS
jgi:hypothetical protein